VTEEHELVGVELAHVEDFHGFELAGAARASPIPSR
jgi:hypothetical protein